jgi:hypothetical protein
MTVITICVNVRCSLHTQVEVLVPSYIRPMTARVIQRYSRTQGTSILGERISCRIPHAHYTCFAFPEDSSRYILNTQLSKDYETTPPSTMMSRHLNGNWHLAPSRSVPLLNSSRIPNNPTTVTATPSARAGLALPETPRDRSSTGETVLSNDRVGFDDGAQRTTSSQYITTTEDFPAEPEYERSLFALAESDATHSLSNYSYSAYEDSVAESYSNGREEVSTFDQLATSVSDRLEMTSVATEGILAHNPFAYELAEIKTMLNVLSELETSLSLIREERLTTTLVPSSRQDLGDGILPRPSAPDSSSSPARSHISELTFVGIDERPPPIPPRSPARRVVIAKSSRHDTRTTKPEKIYKWLSLFGRRAGSKTSRNQEVGVKEEAESEPKGLRQRLRHSFSKLGLRQQRNHDVATARHSYPPRA